MRDQHSSTPAERIVAKLGGTRAAARIIGRARQNVERWAKPRDSGGCGGLIPAHHQVEILRHAAGAGIDIRPADFFPDDVVAALPAGAADILSVGREPGAGICESSVGVIAPCELSHASTPSKSERKP